MTRRIAAAFAAATMLLVLAVPVMAGGWAEIVADAQTSTPFREDTPISVGFKVLQHGETPAGWETATVHFSDLASDERFDVVAKSDGPDGHFVATATIPHAGYWSWQVTLRDLASDHAPVHMTVLTASGQMPPFDPSTLWAAIDRAKMDVTRTMTDRIVLDVERLDQQDSTYRARIDNLTVTTRNLSDERDALRARVDALEAGGAIPILAVISLSVLAGAAAGFVMSWLAGRPAREPKGTVSIAPSPRGADPV